MTDMNLIDPEIELDLKEPSLSSNQKLLKDITEKVDKLTANQKRTVSPPKKTPTKVDPDTSKTRPLLITVTVLLVTVVILLSVNIGVSADSKAALKKLTHMVYSTEHVHHGSDDDHMDDHSDDDNNGTMIFASTRTKLFDSSEDNYCDSTDAGLSNTDCTTAVANAIEQSGRNVTRGFVGAINNSATPPITTPYYQAGLCPVNVHWHLGAEHLSQGEYDAHGTGPEDDYADDHDDHRRLAGSTVRLGYQCRLYDDSEDMFTEPYNWKYCVDMMVGQTYEIHWPHSTVGACNTPLQYQTPFYDGVFCNCPGGSCLDGFGGTAKTHDNVGVQSQTFVVVNDEHYYYPDLIKGMIVDGDYGDDLAIYTGSTTGSSRNNDDACSQYSPITWQVDRKCHLISASSFDKLCADMMSQVDDMSDDLYPHGSRKVVTGDLSSWVEE